MEQRIRDIFMKLAQMPPEHRNNILAEMKQNRPQGQPNRFDAMAQQAMGGLKPMHPQDAIAPMPPQDAIEPMHPQDNIAPMPGPKPMPHPMPQPQPGPQPIPGPQPMPGPKPIPQGPQQGVRPMGPQPQDKGLIMPPQGPNGGPDHRKEWIKKLIQSLDGNRFDSLNELTRGM